MPIIGARMFYATAIYAGNIVAAKTSFPLQLIFGDITEFIVAIVLITAGIMTRHLNRELKADYRWAGPKCTRNKLILVWILK
jgi:hypothetical protein